MLPGHHLTPAGAVRKGEMISACSVIFLHFEIRQLGCRHRNEAPSTRFPFRGKTRTFRNAKDSAAMLVLLKRFYSNACLVSCLYFLQTQMLLETYQYNSRIVEF
jgi:hypothetical protein